MSVEGGSSFELEVFDRAEAVDVDRFNELDRRDEFAFESYSCSIKVPMVWEAQCASVDFMFDFEWSYGAREFFVVFGVYLDFNLVPDCSVPLALKDRFEPFLPGGPNPALVKVPLAPWVIIVFTTSVSFFLLTLELII